MSLNYRHYTCTHYWCIREDEAHVFFYETIGLDYYLESLHVHSFTEETSRSEAMRQCTGSVLALNFRGSHTCTALFSTSEAFENGETYLEAISATRNQ